MTWILSFAHRRHKVHLKSKIVAKSTVMGLLLWLVVKKWSRLFVCVPSTTTQFACSSTGSSAANETTINNQCNPIKPSQQSKTTCCRMASKLFFSSEENVWQRFKKSVLNAWKKILWSIINLCFKQQFADRVLHDCCHFVWIYPRFWGIIRYNLCKFPLNIQDAQRSCHLQSQMFTLYPENCHILRIQSQKMR